MTVGEVLTGLGLILSVLLAYLQIQKNQRAALQLQEAHLRNELKLKLYERFSSVLDEAGNDISKASVQYYSIIAMLDARVRKGLAVAPINTGLELSQQLDSAQRRLNRVLNLLESYEVVFMRFRAFRRHLSTEHSRLLETHSALWSTILIYLPFVHSETGKKVPSMILPSEGDLAEIERLHQTYKDACGEITSHLIDLQIETQNELLGALFDRELPPRHPADPTSAVLVRDDTDLVERPRGRLV
jgi:hypothetical protein